MRFFEKVASLKGYNTVRSLRLCLILLFASAMALGVESKGSAVTKVTRSKVDVGVTIKGKWGTIHKEDGPWNGEPLPDLTRWREEGVLSVYMQKDPSKNGEPTDLYVIDFSMAR